MILHVLYQWQLAVISLQGHFIQEYRRFLLTFHLQVFFQVQAQQWLSSLNNKCVQNVFWSTATKIQTLISLLAPALTQVELKFPGATPVLSCHHPVTQMTIASSNFMTAGAIPECLLGPGHIHHSLAQPPIHLYLHCQFPKFHLSIFSPFSLYYYSCKHLIIPYLLFLLTPWSLIAFLT